PDEFLIHSWTTIYDLDNYFIVNLLRRDHDAGAWPLSLPNACLASIVDQMVENCAQLVTVHRYRAVGSPKPCLNPCSDPTKVPHKRRNDAIKCSCVWRYFAGGSSLQLADQPLHLTD